MINKTVIISGIFGQDGYYLSNLLKLKKFEIIGFGRTSNTKTVNEYKKKFDGIKLYKINNLNKKEIENLLKKFKPRFFFNLASSSSVHNSFINPIDTVKNNSLSFIILLESIKKYSPKTRVFQPSSSEMFGGVSNKLKNNLSSKKNPRSPYAASKIFSHNVSKIYRDSYGLFISCGILFNHESPRRPDHYIIKKICRAFCLIKLKKIKYVEVGDVSISRDWGHAKDYVRAMYLSLTMNKPNDYIIATGRSTSLKKIINLAANFFGYSLLWEKKGQYYQAYDKSNGNILVKFNKSFVRLNELKSSVGDINRTKRILKWKTTVKIESLISEICQSELEKNKLG
jgi:GDPmannose 4,6-dehydratase